MAVNPQKIDYFIIIGLIAHKIIQKDLKHASICSSRYSKFHENTPITLKSDLRASSPNVSKAERFKGWIVNAHALT